MSDIGVFLERETANDEEAQVVAIHVASGSAVQVGDVIFDIENSKATQEVTAPGSGILIHELHIGQSVAFGVSIAQIVPARAWQRDGADAHVVDMHHADLPSPRQTGIPDAAGAVHCLDRFDREPRVSHAAAALLTEFGLTAGQFRTDFITSDDVRAYVKRDASRAPVANTTVDAEKSGFRVAPHKQAEIEAISGGAGGTMLSVLAIQLGKLTVPREPDDFLAGSITDLVIYEASRLLRKYRRLNAFYQQGNIIEHDAVHAGLAIDGGGRLVVYGIENADRVPLPALSAIIADAAARYMSNDLTAAELSRATFSVTDLSAHELDFVLPLLPRGQSCIIGVTRSRASGFRLYAGFDHRVTEGREVAAFLEELQSRLMSFDVTAQSGSAGTGMAAASCDFCGRTLAEAVGKGKEKGLLKIQGGEGHERLCCASCWNGW